MVVIDIIRPCDVEVDVILPYLRTMFEAFKKDTPHLKITSIRIEIEDVK